VTNPSDLDTEAEAKANVMWEFTEADDGAIGNSDLGYTFSQPLVAMSNAYVNDSSSNPHRWVAIFGNGVNSTSAAGNAVLYVLFIEQGQDGSWAQSGDVIKIDTGKGKAQGDGSTPNGIVGIRGIDTGGDGTVDYVYAGDLQGNLYRFNLSSTSPSTWASTTPGVIFQATYTSGSTTKKQPFTSRPILLKHPSKDGFIVIAATGSYMTNEDATNQDIQSIYGIWDDGGATMVTRSQLVEQSFTNYANEEHGYVVRTLSANPVGWRNNGQSSGWVKGWFIDLDVPEAGGSAVEFPGERAVRNLQLRGQFAFVNTVIPKSTASCAGGAGGFELAFDPATGGAPLDVAFDIDGNRHFDLNDNVGNQDGRTHVVAGIRFNYVPTDAAFIGNYRVTQQSDTSVRSVGTNTVLSVQSGRSAWREVGF
jgi:type IV pilus assembly protein PilY1